MTYQIRLKYTLRNGVRNRLMSVDDFSFRQWQNKIGKFQFSLCCNVVTSESDMLILNANIFFGIHYSRVIFQKREKLSTNAVQTF